MIFFFLLYSQDFTFTRFLLVLLCISFSVDILLRLQFLTGLGELVFMSRNLPLRWETITVFQ